MSEIRQRLPDIDFPELIEPVARQLLGPPSKATSGELRWGTNGSVSIDLAKGTWYDHENKVGGGVLDLIRRHGHTDPIEWLKREGIYVNGNGRTKWNGEAKRKAAKPDQKKPLRTRGEFPGLGLPVKIYRYEESDFRFEPKDFRQRVPDGLRQPNVHLGHPHRQHIRLLEPPLGAPPPPQLVHRQVENHRSTLGPG